MLILLGFFLLVFQAELQPSISVAYSLVSQFFDELTPEQELRHIQEVLPEADAFSSKEGDPPYYKAFRIDPQTNRRTVVGLAFFTSDVEPRERGYEGPIKIAVGMNLQGVITRIKTVAHREPYGYFSVDLPRFADQFIGKSIADRFRLGRDIDAITRATMSIGSASRSIRKGARRILKQYLAEEGGERGQ
ncbi:FMN-binding protein [bacterium]|nr:FMN-binding protein [bacterium]